MMRVRSLPSRQLRERAVDRREHRPRTILGVELVDEANNVLARSNDSGAESQAVLNGLIVGNLARTMDREDIRDLRRWFRNAFRRSQTAGFDLICLYGAHGFGVIQHFLSPRTNYLLPDGTVYRGVTKGSVVTYFGASLSRFHQYFSPFGVIKVPYQP